MSALERLVESGCRVRLYARLAYLFADVFKKLSVLRFRYRLVARSQKLYLTLVQYAFCVKLHTEVKTGLTAYRTKKSVRPFVSYYFGDVLEVERLHIYLVGDERIRHYRRRVGVYQNDFVAFLFERKTSLSAAVVELRRLSYDDRTASYDHYFFNICSSRH